MSKPSAIKPTFYDNIRSLYVRPDAEKAKKAGVDEDEKFIHDLRDTNGWNALKKHIEELKTGLDEQMRGAVETGMGEDEIGKRAVVLVLGKGLLDSIINKVEDSYESVEEAIHGESK